jgi:hypothetical protein
VPEGFEGEAPPEGEEGEEAEEAEEAEDPPEGEEGEDPPEGEEEEVSGADGALGLEGCEDAAATSLIIAMAGAV